MGKTSSAVKNRYNNKAYDRITIMPKKGSKDRYKAYAESQGKSLTALIVELLEREIKENGFINRAIDETIKRDTDNQE